MLGIKSCSIKLLRARHRKLSLQDHARGLVSNYLCNERFKKRLLAFLILGWTATVATHSRMPAHDLYDDLLSAFVDDCAVSASLIIIVGINFYTSRLLKNAL